MTYHIRVPLKATVVFKANHIPDNKIFDEWLRESFDAGKGLLTAECIYPTERSIVQVCDDCGAELTEDWQKEIGMCDECAKKEGQRIADESRNPDQK